MSDISPINDQIALSRLLGKTFYEATLNDEALGAYLFIRLRPSQGFTEEQNALLSQAKLRVPDISVAWSLLQSVPPDGFAFVPILATDGFWYLNSDLLTDCLRPGDHYEWAKSYLVNLLIVPSDGIEWVTTEG